MKKISLLRFIEIFPWLRNLFFRNLSNYHDVNKIPLPFILHFRIFERNLLSRSLYKFEDKKGSSRFKQLVLVKGFYEGANFCFNWFILYCILLFAKQNLNLLPSTKCTLPVNFLHKIFKQSSRKFTNFSPHIHP